MKKNFVILCFMIGLISGPSIYAAMGGGLYPPVDISIPPFPQDTFEGSAISSHTFNVQNGDVISLTYNFISGEFWMPSGEWVPDFNDWYGAALLDPGTGEILHFQYLGDVYTHALNGDFSPIDNWNNVWDSNFDTFLVQTGIMTAEIVVPAGLDGRDIQLGMGVFDLFDPNVASALLIDNILLNDAVLGGAGSGDFETNPFISGGFFYSDGGPAGYYSWQLNGNGNFDPDRVDEPGSGHYAYISTVDGPLSPVPISSTILLLGSGLVCLVGIRKRSLNYLR